MKKTIVTGILIVLLSSASALAKTYDLVLIHGLTNKHQWSDNFLKKCLSIYGSGNVYCVYTSDSDAVWSRTIDGKLLYGIGDNDFSAGDDGMTAQAINFREKTDILNAYYGLSYRFSIIAHSAGGVVSRRYIALEPDRVADLVTLGTPHQGTEVADDWDFLAFFIGADDAVADLTTSAMAEFNRSYPVSSAELYDSGNIYTIEGDGDGYDLWGWAGELYTGWWILSLTHWLDSDGVTPTGYGRVAGAVHVKTFWSYDHYELVTEPAVAAKAASYLR